MEEALTPTSCQPTCGPTMSLYSSWFGTSKGGVVKNPTDETEEEEEDPPMECDYDKDVTELYEALEDKAWQQAIDYYIPKGDQARTWVTRYDTDGSVRWTQLPIHAALLFKAPTQVIKALVEAYPKGARCVDDQKNLPLHLAFRHGASPETICLLIEAFPGAVHAKGHKKRLPLDCAPLGSNKALYKIITTYTGDVEKEYEAKRTLDIEKVKEAEATLEHQKERVSELEKSTQDLVERERQTKEELEKIQMQLQAKTGKKAVKILSKGEKEAPLPTPVAVEAEGSASGTEPKKKKSFGKSIKSLFKRKKKKDKN